MGNILDRGSVLDRIKQCYNLKGNADLARFLGVAPNTITNWYGRSTFDLDVIYTKCVDVDFNWLLTGHGSMFRNDQEQPAPQPVVQPTPPGEDSFIYKMYEKEKEENKALIEEIGGLKERLRVFETALSEVPINKSPDNTGNSQKVTMIPAINLSKKEEILEL